MHPFGKAAAALCALVAALVVSCVPAGAEVTHRYLSSITEVPAEGPKGEAVALPGLLGEVNSMTIDEGKLYLAEQFGSFGTSRIDEFDTSTHAFLKQFDHPAAPVYAAQFGIAVGHATGEPQVYVGAGGETSGVVVPFDAEGHQLGSPWVGEDTPAGSFSGQEGGGHLESVAVDNDSTTLLGDWAAGDVLVETRSQAFHRFPAVNVIDVFKSEAGGKEKYITQLTGTCASPGTCPGEVVPFNSPSWIAENPQNGALVVADFNEEGTNKVVDMFKPAPLADEYEFVGSVTGSPRGAFHEINAIAVDGGEGSFADGAFYVLEGGDVYQFDSSGRYVGQFMTSGQANSIAVDPGTHDVYVGASAAGEGQVEIFGPSLLLPDITTAPASSVAPESVTLNGTVNPDNAGAGQTTCQFVWGASESFGHVQPCSAPIAEGGSQVPVAVPLEGLEPDTTYYYRLQASNGNGTNEGEASQTLHFTTPGPGIAEEAALGVSSTSVTLAAKVDPHGARTTTYFQYGTTTTYGSAIPAAPGGLVGAGEGGIEVTYHLQGLSPATTYHYRVAVVSEVQIEPGVFQERTFHSRDRTFTTQSVGGGSLVLPDGRAWELVSPADKHGSSIYPLGSPFKENSHPLVQSSASGDSITYRATAPVGVTAPAYTLAEQVLSSRGANGWSSQDLALAHQTAAGSGNGDFPFFSEDLSLALAEPTGPFTSLAPEATPPETERSLYLRHDDTCGVQPSACYLPLVTGAPGYADVPPGTVIDPNPGGQHNSLQFGGATTDLSHVLFETQSTLTPESLNGRNGLYEWSAGKPPSEELQLISGEFHTYGLGGIPIINGKNAISKDGSRVLFQAEGGHLDQRDTTDHQTVQLDEVQPRASGAGSPEAFLQAASSDGSIVYFTDTQKLTEEATGFVPNLYECRMIEVAGKDKCSLTDLTPGTAVGVEGVALGASEDGAYIYFVAADVLSNRPNADGENAVAGRANLYGIRDGTIQLVAVLSPRDRRDWDKIGTGGGEAFPETIYQTARVSPDGRYLVFMSDRSLTGYDNFDANSGKPDEEVFLFDSVSGRLACVSCNPSGARPEGVEIGGAFASNTAASIPGWTEYARQASLRQPRYLTDSGRLFFDSSDALVPQDVNKEEDVYEYEPAGVGDCSAQSSGYEAASGGCVGLISSGTARGESTFMEASESGDDVFFLTTERLVGSDTDTAADIYDAHVCSTAVPCTSPPPSPPPPCATADACRAAPSPQSGIFGSPASTTFVGAGNLVSKQVSAVTPKSLTRGQKLARALRACHRKAKRRRAACERKAHKRYSGKPARGARVTNGGRG
jgi:hypothetical protein